AMWMSVFVTCLYSIYNSHLLLISLFFLFFFFNDPATTEIYTLSLHDALPIFPVELQRRVLRDVGLRLVEHLAQRGDRLAEQGARSEEHTSELQSRFDLVCRLLLEKKKKKKANYNDYNTDITASQHTLSTMLTR